MRGLYFRFHQRAVSNFLLSLPVVLFAVALAPKIVLAETYVPVEDEIIYGTLSRLEAEGVIVSGLLDARPISRKEAYRLLREAEANSVSRGEFIKSLVRSLKNRLGPEPAGTARVKPIDSAYVSFVHTNAENHVFLYGAARENEQPLNYNNNGDLYKRGMNGRLGFTGRLENWGPLSAELNVEHRGPAASFTGYNDALYEKEDLTAPKAYAVFDLGWDAVVGRDSQWWGPGYHGALLLTNNAEPLTMLKITNPEPITLPWIFKRLGSSRFTFFVTNLEKARAIPEPYFYGLRFDFKPSPYVEFAVEKTALLGGRKGRKEDLRTWLRSLYGANDSDNTWSGPDHDPGDQRAGIDLKLTIPWSIQPMQIYFEAAGEDEYNNLPNLWAFVGGVYLPRIAGAESFDFRAEYAMTRGRVHSPYIWYVHGIYTSYTHEGNILGHHIGTDANDLFAEVSYLLPEKNGRVFLSYDREEHNLYVAGNHETLVDGAAGVKLSLTDHIDLLARYSRGRLKNAGNMSGQTMTLSAYETRIEYRF